MQKSTLLRPWLELSSIFLLLLSQEHIGSILALEPGLAAPARKVVTVALLGRN